MQILYKPYSYFIEYTRKNLDPRATHYKTAVTGWKVKEHSEDDICSAQHKLE